MSRREELAEKYAKLIPVKYRKLFRKAAKGEVSPRQAIKAKCQECVCYEDMRPRIRDCESHMCPLWAYRPYQDYQKNDK